ncbi:hypothetical protein [Nonomuraea soli]|uniref:DUF320 domain-containing protein n=1 Tax=Nonomuraea soli TaxID=1032476 RepID=A0A7W0HMJ7_9ACTN|nr:hypothetical protein [Nonomuraea soli]MBA2888802.1 hypothetical protein [Nonomuraea soli]
MLKKICVTGIVVAAAGVSLMAAPASADTDTHNSSWNNESSQSGNNFGNVFAGNVGGGRSTNVNNINGNAVTGTNGSWVGVRVFVD